MAQILKEKAISPFWVCLAAGILGGLALMHVWWEEPSRLSVFADGLVRGRVERSLRQEADNAVMYLKAAQSFSETLVKRQIAEYVDLASSVLMATHKQLSGKLPDSEVQKILVESLRDARFLGGRGYYFIDDQEGRCILLPINPHLEGTSLMDNRDDRGVFIMRALIEAASQPGDRGFVRYRWYSPKDRREMADKISYVRRFAPFNWLVGAGEYLPVIEELVRSDSLARLREVRFGETGRLSILGLDDAILLSGDDSALDGQNAATVPVEIGDTVRRMRQMAQQGGGVMEYLWPHPLSGRLSLRLAWVSEPTDWGWVVVAAMHYSDYALAEEKTSDVSHRLFQSLETGLVLGLLIVIAAQWGWRWGPRRDERSGEVSGSSPSS